MVPRSTTVLFSVIVLLAAGAGLVLVFDSGPRPTATAHAREFQRLVGGLGFGPAVDLSTCAFAFDPRLCPDCAQNHGPIAGGIYFCPHHAGSVLYYPPLRERRAGDGK